MHTPLEKQGWPRGSAFRQALAVAQRQKELRRRDGQVVEQRSPDTSENTVSRRDILKIARRLNAGD
jgi:hypothetical protein